MRSKLYKLILLTVFATYINAQETKQIPISYNTTGYAESNSTTNKTLPPSPLTPSVNSEMIVSESGALVYTLPIETMKGLNNFQPNIALVYNSQNGNGQAGWGWNIAGLSTITRGGKSKEIDGLTIGNQFDNTDPFYLDGQRLIKVNESTFVTEKFSKVKITKPNSGDYQFIIQYPDGKIAKYKELVTGQFYISTFIDSFNHEIHYTYQVENKVPALTKISYGATNVTNDKFYINFIYKARNKNILVYRKGESFITTKILSEINVGSTYVQLYRKYSLTHDYIEDNSVERLRTVIVTNETGESLKPLNFNYNTSSQGVVSIAVAGTYKVGSSANGLGSVTMGNFFNDNHERLTPAFQERWGNTYKINANGILNANITNNSGTLLFAGKVLDLSNKITEKDQLIVVNESPQGNGDLYNPSNPSNQQLKDEITFDIKNLVTGEQRKVKVPVKGGLVEVVNYVPSDPYDNYNSNTYETSYTRDETRREYIQGDFNNDGLVDFLIVEPENYTRGNRLYWVEVGKQNSGNTVEVNPVVFNETLNLQYKDIYPIEFDGDGIPELMIVDKYTAKYSVYKINFTSNTIDAIVSNQVLSNFGEHTPIFFGDFNGDGLTDFITPQTIYEIPNDDNSGVKLADTYYRMQTETLLWWKYTGNGLTFLKNQEDYTAQKIAYLKPSQNNYIKKSTFWQKFWNGQPDSYEFTRFSTHNIIISDFNNDGRSDIITLDKIGKSKYTVSGTFGGVQVDNLSNSLTRMTAPLSYSTFLSTITNRVNFYENKNLQGGTFQQISTYSIENERISPLSLIMSSTKLDYLNGSSVGVMINDVVLGNSISINIDNRAFLEKEIQEVNNGSQVLQKIEYRNMHPELFYYYSYNPDQLTYIYKSQDLKYPFYVHKLNPSLNLVNKIHTIFDGKILSKEYRYENGIQNLEGKGFIGFQKTFSSDPYESEIKNGKYINKNPAKGLFWKIETRDPSMDNAIVKSTYGGINKFFTEDISINKKFDKGNHQYLILATDEVSKDNLKKIVISKKYVYDEADDLKLKNAYTDFSGAGSATSTYNYKPEFYNADHYFYGKIASVENTTYREGNSFTTKDDTEYFPNGNVSHSKKYSNDSSLPPIVTSYTYTNSGNLETETISTLGIASQTTTYEYDSTDRYVNKTTTPDGLSSSAVVNSLGRKSSETSSLGLPTSYLYDSWGNITEITDFLGKKTTISKSVVSDTSIGGIYNLHKKREGGTETIATFDKFDREIQMKTQSLNNRWVVIKTEYDIYGKKTRISEPFFEGEPVKWNKIEYDELDRPIKNIDFKGLIITTCYEGLKITVDDGFSKKTSQTLDAMGFTVRHQDRGGIINYFYYPNGTPKQTDYEGIKTNFEIDSWGNKKKMIDPSAGTFTYEYDNLSRLTKESSPKGYTLYTYDDLGRLQTEKNYGNSAGENTNIEKTYSYNSQNKLLQTVSGVNNGNSFTYTTYYDQYHRINGKKEETPNFIYTSSTTFDSFGRGDVVNISTSITNPNYISNSSIKNIYDSNGILVQQNDNITGSMIWHLTDITVKVETKQMEFGNGYTIANEYYDLDYSLYKIKHQNTNNGNLAVDLEYSYNMSKGVLNFRKNNIFNKKEDFTYDMLNRLLTEAVNGTITNQYTYDKRGRITSNTELGKYNYNESNYKLQGIDFNLNGQNINSQRGFASIGYNAFKSPIKITLAGKDELNFEYNILKTRYSMKSSVTGQQKYYSSDFAIEITKENNGKTQIITYLTGNPYAANYIKKEVLIGGNITESANYFLHRDNLGSIIAISKTDGSIVEKRFFDAWGNLKGLVNVSGQMITDPVAISNYTMFLDRGYTGHEHLWKVGLINMNARLYDPILRKFLSTDNFVQDPFNTQSYDRFGYVFNNPLLYIDVDGHMAFAVAVVVGVAIAVTMKAITNMISGIPFWYGMGKAAVMGAISSAVSFGIGSAAASFGQTISIGKAIFEAGAHAITSGTMAAIDGQFGGSAFLSGAVSSLIASGINALGINFSKSTNNTTFHNTFGREYMKASMIVAGGLSGGISASIAGGKFSDGFRQGLITSGLNAVAHLIMYGSGKSIIRDAVERAKLDPNKEATINDAEMLLEKVSLLKDLNIGAGVKIVGYNSTGTFGRYTNDTVYLNTNKLYNNTILDYAITLYHELRHHWFIVSGMYIKMRTAIGINNRMILADEHGFDEYQAAYSTSLVSYGENNRHYWNEVGLFNQHECWIDTQKINLKELKKVFNKNDGKF